MSPERRLEVERLYKLASRLDAGERDAFLTVQCGADDALRKQVQTLLDHSDDLPTAKLTHVPVPAGHRPHAPLAIQRLGKYEVQAEIGRGGFGSVYAAWDPMVDRKVAIKVLLAGADPDIMVRFRNEASSAGKLRHQNIVTIYDFGEEQGVPFIVMEMLEGHNLQQIISAKTQLSLDQKVNILRQSAAGLDHAHLNGLVHRDIKPGNIMVLRDFTVKLLDFGIARLVQTTNARLTQQGILIGTASYMAPEQLRGKDSDALSDIFSLGVVAYELLAGRHPFHANDHFAVMFAITSLEPEPLRKYVPDCPAALEAVVMRALAKDPDQRYSSAEDIVLDLEPILGELRQKRASQLLIETEKNLAAEQLDSANGLVREILDLDPGNSAARQLRDTIQRKLHRRAAKPRIDLLLSESEDLLAARQFDAAVERLDVALRLDRTDARVQALRDRGVVAQAQAKRAEHLVEEAREAFRERNLTGAHLNILAALQSDREHPEATALLQQILSQIDDREREGALREGLMKVRASLVTEAFDEGLTLLTALGAQHPDSAEVRGLKAEVLKRKAESERRDKLLKSLTSARDLVRQKRFAHAISILEPLALEFPNAAEVADLLSFARQTEQAEMQAQKVTETEQSAERFLTAQNFAAALSVVEEALTRYPADGSLARLQVRVHSAKSAAARERAIREIAAQGEGMLAKEKFPEATHLLDGAVREHGNQAVLVDLRSRVEAAWAAWKRAQTRQATIADVRRFLQKGQAAEAISAIQQTLADSPGDTELLALLSSAQKLLTDKQRAEAVSRLSQEIESQLTAKQLDRAQTAQEAGIRKYPGEPALEALGARVVAAQEADARRRNLQIVLDSIQTLLQAGRFREALDQAEAALKEHPDDNLVRLKREIETQWEREKLRRTLAQSREHLEAGRIDQAIALLEFAAGERTDLAEIKALLSYARERKQTAEKQAAIEKLMIEGAGLADAGRLEEALRTVDQGCLQHPAESGLQRLRDMIAERLRIATELKKQAEERQRQIAEQRRIEAERQRELEERAQREAALKREEAERARLEADERERQLAERRKVEAERQRELEERVQRELALKREEAEWARLEAERKRGEEEARQAAEVLEKAGQLRKERKVAAALTVVEEAIERSGHRPALDDLRQQLVIERDREVSALQTLSQARDALENGQIEVARHLASYLDTVLPGAVDTRDLNAAIAAKQKVQAEIEAAARQAEGLRTDGRYEEALAFLDARLREYPGAQILEAVRDRIGSEYQAFLKEQDRKRALVEISILPERARQSPDDSDLQKIVARAEELAAAFSSDKEFSQVAKAVRKAAASRRAEWRKIKAVAETAPVKVPPPVVREPKKTTLPPVMQITAPRWPLAVAAGVIAVLGIGGLIWRLASTGGTALQVSTNPAGANVTAGNVTCTTPNCALNLPPGRYQVQARKAGYRAASANVEIGKGSPAPLKLNLVPLPMRLLVGTNFTEGSVTLDGVAAGQLRNGEFLLDSVPVGAHAVEIQSRDGRATLRFEAAAGQAPKILSTPSVTETQAIVVSGYASSAEIRCDCLSGDVTVDGKAAGRLEAGRLALPSLAAGTHQFRVAAPDGIRDSVVDLRDEPSVNLFLSADRNLGTLVVEAGQDDVQVFLDNRPQALLTHGGLLRLPVAVKKYSVRVEKSGYRRPPAKLVEVKKGAMARISFELTPLDAVLAILETLPGTRVSIDGRLAGVTGADGTLRANVTPGSHSIELTKGGYAPRLLKSLEFGPGATVNLGRGDVELTEVRAPTPVPPPVKQPVTPAPDPRAVEAEEWGRIRNTGSIDQLEDFRRKYPKGDNNEQAARRIEQIEWDNLQNSRDAASLEAFLRKYPNSANADQARRRIEEIEWAGVNKQSADQIRAFLQRHPGSAHAAEANTALASLQQTEVLAADRRSVNQVLSQYQQAYGAKNIQDLVALRPQLAGSSQGRSLREAFRSSQSIALELSAIRPPDISGDTAVVQCHQTLRQNNDGKQLTHEDTVTITLRRSGKTWTIQDIK